MSVRNDLIQQRLPNGSEIVQVNTCMGMGGLISWSTIDRGAHMALVETSAISKAHDECAFARDGGVARALNRLSTSGAVVA